MEQTQTYITTPEHFDIFKAEARKWLDRFGLKGWSVCFRHLPGESLGRISWDREGRVATIVLCKEWGEVDEPTPAALGKVAFHEVCELLLGRLFDMAAERNALLAEAREEKHNLIRILENVLWEPEKNRRYGEKEFLELDKEAWEKFGAHVVGGQP